MDIAGIGFCLHATGLPVLPDRSSTYAPFFRDPPPGPPWLRIDLDVEIGGMPGLASLQKEFDGGSWSLYRAGGDWVFSLNPPAPDLAPMWTARISPDFSRGTVFCHERLVQTDGPLRGIVNPVLNRLDQLLAMYLLGRNNGVLIHAAGLGLGGRGAMFPGRSGAGKSTISRLFAAARVAGLDLLSDDRMIVREVEGAYRAFGTPWAGDALIAANRSVPLEWIFFLVHGEANRVDRLNPTDAFERMLPLVSVPWYDRDMILRITETCERLARSVRAYDLHVVPTPDIVGYVNALMDDPHE